MSDDSLTPAECTLKFFTKDDFHTAAMLDACIETWQRAGRRDRGDAEAREFFDEHENYRNLFEMVRLGAPKLRGAPTPLPVPAADLMTALAKIRADYHGSN